MKLPPWVPTPEEGLRLLSPVTPHLQPALDNALFKAATYNESESLNCDGTTLLTLLRAHAKSHLVRLNLAGVEFKDWALSGIEFRVNDAIFRCWKGTEHELPRPGESEGRKRFLNQQYHLPFDGDNLPRIRNFVVLYVFEPGNQLALWLVCPKRYIEEEKIPEAWWWAKIEDPTLTMNIPTNVGAPPQDDLSIQRKKRTKNDTQD